MGSVQLDAIEPGRGQQVVGDEKRIEAKLLSPHRKSTDLVAVFSLLTGQEIGRDEHAQLHDADSTPASTAR